MTDRQKRAAGFVGSVMLGVALGVGAMATRPTGTPDGPIGTSEVDAATRTVSKPRAPLSADLDADGVVDIEDRCPWNAGSIETGGCP